MPRPSDVGVGVAVALVDPNGFVLLGCRQGSHGQGLWSFPGGWFDRTDKNIIEAARREVWEETGIDLSLPFLRIERLTETICDFPENGFASVTLFRVVWLSHRPKVINREPDKCSEWKWFSLSCLPTALFGGVTEALQTIGMRLELERERRAR